MSTVLFIDIQKFTKLFISKIYCNKKPSSLYIQLRLMLLNENTKLNLIFIMCEKYKQFNLML